MLRLGVFAALATCACAADWPQLYGPERNGISPETGLAHAWPAAGPKVLWTFPLGEGFGGGAVRNGKVYILDRVNSKQDVARALDLATGKELWSFAYDAPGTLNRNGSRSFPAVDEQNVYTAGPFGDVYCFSQTTHQPVWKTNIYKQFQSKWSLWGCTQCPLLYKNSVIVAAQCPEAGVVAFDKASGKVLWKSPALPGRSSYVSPKLVTIDGVDQVVMISAGRITEVSSKGGGAKTGAKAPNKGKSNGSQSAQGSKGATTPPDETGTIAGIDANSGRILWTYLGWQCQTPVSNVTSIGDGRLFITGNYKAGSVLFKVEKKGDSFAVTELLRTRDMECHVHAPVLYKDYLYANSVAHQDGFMCMGLDGKVMWRTQKSPNCDRGCQILADGLLYVLDSLHGILYFAEADPSSYKQLGYAKLLDTNECMGAMTLSDGKLLLRDKKQMKCIDVKGPYPGAVARPYDEKAIKLLTQETSATLSQGEAETPQNTQSAGEKQGASSKKAGQKKGGKGQDTGNPLAWRDAQFKKLDTDSDGFLSLDEFKAGFPGADAADAKQVFDLRDTNKDGKLSMDEYRPILFEEMALKYDTNKDGRITPEEMKKGLPNPTTAENTFKDRDKNGDGVITKEDFKLVQGGAQSAPGAKAGKAAQSPTKEGAAGKFPINGKASERKASPEAGGNARSSSAGNATSYYLVNGDFTSGTQNWVFHNKSKADVFSVVNDVPPGVNGRSLRYSKSAEIPDEDRHVNYTMTVPAPGSYVLSFWCKTTKPLVPLVVVRKNWVKADLDPAKVFVVRNDGAWKHYEFEFQIPDSWPLAFTLELAPGVKGELGVGYSGETLFADMRCAPKQGVPEKQTGKMGEDK